MASETERICLSLYESTISTLPRNERVIARCHVITLSGSKLALRRSVVANKKDLHVSYSKTISCFFGIRKQKTDIYNNLDAHKRVIYSYIL